MHLPRHLPRSSIALTVTALVIHFLIILGQCPSLAANGEWSIRGNCPQPPPVHNAYRTVADHRVDYECAPGSASDDPTNMSVPCIGTNAAYSPSIFPTCTVQCGTPPTWSFAAIDSADASKTAHNSGDSITYRCTHGVDFSPTTATCHEDFGWKLNHPVCLEDTNFKSEMDYDFGDGDEIVEGDCVWVYNSTSNPTIGLIMKNPLHLINVYSVEFVVDVLNNDNKWLDHVYLFLKRNGSNVNRFNVSAETDIASLTKTILHFVRGVNEIYLETMSSNSIGFCSPNIQGRTSEGGCGEPIPPFKTKLQNAWTSSSSTMPDNTVSLDCKDGFHYIGGQRYLYCDYYRKWIRPKHFMECTDRTNHAIDYEYTIDITPDNNWVPGNTTTVLTFDGVFDKTEIENQGFFVTVPGYAAFITLTIKLKEHLDVERVTIDLWGEDQFDIEVQVYAGLSDTAGKSCHFNDDLQYGSSQTFVCHTRPHVNRIQIEINSDANEDEQWTISDVVIIGRMQESHDETLECYMGESGTDYKGYKNTSIDGQACLPWSSSGLYQLSQFPDKILEPSDNFCRNPDPDNFHNPFCLTTSGPLPCSVPPCDRICSVNQRGDDYLGTVSDTKSSSNCLFWSDSEFPFVRESQFLDGSVDEAMNFCRNPGMSQTQPWCYTSDNPVEFEHCVIPNCPESDFNKLEDQEWIYHNLTDTFHLANQHHIERCFVYNTWSGETGKDAWLELHQDMMSEACVSIGSGVHIQSVCVTQRMQNDTLFWHNWVLVCPEITTTTTTTASTTTVNAQSTSLSSSPQTEQTATAAVLPPLGSTSTVSSTTETTATSSEPTPTVSGSSTTSPQTTTLPPSTSSPQTTTLPPSTSSPQKMTSPSSTSSPQTTTLPPSTSSPQTTTLPPSTSSPQSMTSPSSTSSPQTTTSPQTTSSPQSTTLPSPTSSPQTTTLPSSTSSPQTLTSPQTTSSPQTTTLPSSTSSPQTTTLPSSTSSPQTTTLPSSTSSSQTTTLPSPTSSPQTTTSPQTTSSPQTSTSPQTTTLPQTTTSPHTSTSPQTTTSPSSTSSPQTTPSSTSSPQTATSPQTTTSPQTATSPTSTSSPQTTQSPTSSPQTTTSPPSTSSQNCTWSCPIYFNLSADSEAMDEIRQEIVNELTVDKSKLSSTTRAKTSAQDNRDSAVTTGYLGVALMFTIASLIVVPDAIVLVNNVQSLISFRRAG